MLATRHGDIRYQYQGAVVWWKRILEAVPAPSEIDELWDGMCLIGLMITSKVGCSKRCIRLTRCRPSQTRFSLHPIPLLRQKRRMPHKSLHNAISEAKPPAT